jgi:hypothetical protein
VAGNPTLDEVADELYALPPDQFIATRDERIRAARAAGDRALATDLGTLRRPTTGAWVINLLVRAEPELLDQMLELGAELRAAQRELRGPQLRELTAQRQRVVAELVRSARRQAAEVGHPVSAETGYEVEQTLHAALADPDVARQVCTGRLVRPVAHTGFGAEVVTGGGPAPRSAGPASGGTGQAARAQPSGTAGRRDRAAGGTGAKTTAADRDRAAQERAEQEQARRQAEHERLRAERDAAQADLDRVEAELQAAEERLSGTERARDEAAALTETLEEQLNAARRAHREASSQIREARQHRDATARIRDGTARRLADTTARLDRLDRAT